MSLPKNHARLVALACARSNSVEAEHCARQALAELKTSGVASDHLLADLVEAIARARAAAKKIDILIERVPR